LVIVLGLIASLAAFVQIVLMVARSGMLVILAGILPISAAATNTEMGKGWFRKCVGWLVAFLLRAGRRHRLRGGVPADWSNLFALLDRTPCPG
jgi:hypothetical protein